MDMAISDSFTEYHIYLTQYLPIEAIKMFLNPILITAGLIVFVVYAENHQPKPRTIKKDS
jgi:hypothetical protein